MSGRREFGETVSQTASPIGTTAATGFFRLTERKKKICELLHVEFSALLVKDMKLQDQIILSVKEMINAPNN